MPNWTGEENWFPCCERNTWNVLHEMTYQNLGFGYSGCNADASLSSTWVHLTVSISFYFILNYSWSLREFLLAERPLSSVVRARACIPYGQSAACSQQIPTVKVRANSLHTRSVNCVQVPFRHWRPNKIHYPSQHAITQQNLAKT